MTSTPWDALYAAGYGSLDLPGTLTALRVRPGGRVLDVGCGRGEHLARVADAWNAAPFGIDSSREALSHAREARIARADAAALPFRNGSFDLVYSLGVIEHLPDTATAVNESFRVLAPGGWAYHSVPHTGSVWTWCVRPLKKALGRFPVGREASFSVRRMRRMFEAAGFADVAFAVMPFAAYDCYGATWPLPLLYRAEDFLTGRVPGIGFFLHMWGRKA